MTNIVVSLECDPVLVSSCFVCLIKKLMQDPCYLIVRALGLKNLPFIGVNNQMGSVDQQDCSNSIKNVA